MFDLLTKNCSMSSGEKRMGFTMLIHDKSTDKDLLSIQRYDPVESILYKTVIFFKTSPTSLKCKTEMS